MQIFPDQIRKNPGHLLFGISDQFQWRIAPIFGDGQKREISRIFPEEGKNLAIVPLKKGGLVQQELEVVPREPEERRKIIRSFPFLRDQR